MDCVPLVVCYLSDWLLEALRSAELSARDGKSAVYPKEPFSHWATANFLIGQS